MASAIDPDSISLIGPAAFVLVNQFLELCEIPNTALLNKWTHRMFNSHAEDIYSPRCQVVVDQSRDPSLDSCVLNANSGDIKFRGSPYFPTRGLNMQKPQSFLLCVARKWVFPNAPQDHNPALMRLLARSRAESVSFIGCFSPDGYGGWVAQYPVLYQATHVNINLDRISYNLSQLTGV